MHARLLIVVSLLIVHISYVSLAADNPETDQGPTITLQTNRISLGKALAVIVEKTGIPVKNARGEADKEIRLDLRQARFWPALDALAEASGSRISVSARDGRIALVKRGQSAYPPISHSGPFRVSLQRVTVSRDLEIGIHSATAGLEVAWEPALQLLFLETRPQKLVVKADVGQDLLAHQAGSVLAPVDGRIALAFDLPLPAPPRAAARLTMLEGQLSAIGPTKMLAFRFSSLDQLEKAPLAGQLRQQKLEGINCKILKVTLANDRWSVQVALDTPPGGEKLDSYQSWIVNNEMALEDATHKKRIVASSYVVESASERRAIISYHFGDRDQPPSGKPGDWKLTYTAPAAIVTTTIPFRFKDVPLP